MSISSQCYLHSYCHICHATRCRAIPRPVLCILHATYVPSLGDDRIMEVALVQWLKTMVYGYMKTMFMVDITIVYGFSINTIWLVYGRYNYKTSENKWTPYIYYKTSENYGLWMLMVDITIYSLLIWRFPKTGGTPSHQPFIDGFSIINQPLKYLVGGLEHVFSTYWVTGNNSPTWLIFFRGVETCWKPTTRISTWVFPKIDLQMVVLIYVPCSSLEAIVFRCCPHGLQHGLHMTSRACKTRFVFLLS